MTYGWGIAPLTLTQDIFVFDWNSLHSNTLWVRVTGVDYDDLWGIDIETYNSPQVDWGWVLSYLYHKKTITFSLSLYADTIPLLNELVDNFKKRTSKQEWLLEVTIDWVIRTCTATRSSLDFGRKYYNLNFLPNVKISFVTMSPHRVAKIWESKTYSITWNHYEDLDYKGTAPVYHKTYISFASAGNSWITSLVINTRGTALTVTNSIINWDMLIVDGVNKVVTLNWTEIDYTWIFKPLVPWSNIVTYVFNWWAIVSATMNILYNKTFY